MPTVDVRPTRRLVAPAQNLYSTQQIVDPHRNRLQLSHNHKLRSISVEALRQTDRQTDGQTAQRAD